MKAISTDLPEPVAPTIAVWAESLPGALSDQ